MTPKARRSELIAVRVQHEQRWAYGRSLEHLSYRAMRQLANRPESEGGLGYDLSEHALKALVRGYLDGMREVLAVDRDEQIARELHDHDLMQREAAHLVALTNAALDRAAQLEALDVHAAGIKLKALDRYRAAGVERRKLLGLDAPVEHRVEVTTRDAVTDELNEMLARAGHDPIEVTHD